jgi:hypothetical protein
MTTNRLWHDLYAAPMLELDRAALPAAAQAAIRQAMKEPKRSPAHETSTGVIGQPVLRSGLSRLIRPSRVQGVH